MPTPKQPGRRRLEVVAEPAWIDAVAAAAKAADRSVSGYIRAAVNAAMRRDHSPPPKLDARRRGRPPRPDGG